MRYKCSTTLAEQIAIRMTKADRTKLEAIAQKHCLSLSGAMLKILREYEAKDDLPIKTDRLQRAIDQHMTAIKELDRVKRMYKRELKAANEIRSKNDHMVGKDRTAKVYWNGLHNCCSICGRPIETTAMTRCAYCGARLEQE